MINRSFTPLCGALLFVAAIPALGQVVWNANEDVKFSFGFQGQVWADENQSPSTGGYAQNLYLRRARLILGGEIGHNISFFVETDDPNLGKTPKAMGSGFMLQDAFLEWKICDALRVDGGLMLVPLSHNTLQSTASYLTLDLSPLTTINNSATQSAGLRDTGFQLRGFLLGDHLLYRVGLFGGVRNVDGRNSLRSAGYLQYDFFKPETGYVLAGTALGKSKLLGVSAGFDTQGSYRAFSGGVHGAIPVRDGDEIGGQVQYLMYDGRREFTTIAKQNDVLVETGYYFHKIKTQPFGKFETQAFSDSAAATKDVNRYGVGANYYVRGQNLKFTFQYLKAKPRTVATNFRPANEFTVQLQLFYF